jgi:hypothetical protein
LKSASRLRRPHDRLAHRRQRRPQRLPHRPAMRPEPDSQLSDRQLRLQPAGPADLLEQLHPQPLWHEPNRHGDQAANADPLNQRSRAKSDEHAAAQVGPKQMSTPSPAAMFSRRSGRSVSLPGRTPSAARGRTGRGQRVGPDCGVLVVSGRFVDGIRQPRPLGPCAGGSAPWAHSLPVNLLVESVAAWSSPRRPFSTGDGRSPRSHESVGAAGRHS